MKTKSYPYDQNREEGLSPATENYRGDGPGVNGSRRVPIKEEEYLQNRVYGRHVVPVRMDGDMRNSIKGTTK